MRPEIGPAARTGFRSTRLSRASTSPSELICTLSAISIHKALASLDCNQSKYFRKFSDFDPQGSREPRRMGAHTSKVPLDISIHKALASLDSSWTVPHHLRSTISIHKALASLDGKNAQLFLHLCHIYMLHIIHLLQIVYQVEISSRNLIVFSGQL